MFSKQSKREKIINYLFGHLSENEKRHVEEKLKSDSEFQRIYKTERENLTLQSYLNNELPLHERIEFERQIRNNSYLRRTVYLHKRLLNADIFKTLEYKKLLEKVIKESEHNTKKSFLARAFSATNIMKLVVAASILFMVYLGVEKVYRLQEQPLENKLFKEYYKPFFDNKATRFHTNSSLLYEAKKKYNNGNYIEALDVFENLPNSLTINIEKHFYSALIYMELKQYNRAIDIFNNLIDNSETKQILPYVKWYLALCYLQTNNTDKAIGIFEEIVEYKGYYSKPAKKILSRIKP